MPKFNIEMVASFKAQLTIEADSLGQATEKAMDMWQPSLKDNGVDILDPSIKYWDVPFNVDQITLTHASPEEN